MQVKVTATVPILCANGTKNCSIIVHLVQSTTDIMISKCILVFAAINDPFSSQAVQVIAKRDFVDDARRNLKITQNITSSPGAPPNGDWSENVGVTIGVSLNFIIVCYICFECFAFNLICIVFLI